MFLGFSKTMARFGKFRLGVDMRLTKKNAPYLFIILMFIWMFQLMWYMMVLCFLADVCHLLRNLLVHRVCIQ
ncbi:MAG TPA: hypothetical protein DDZ99_00520 [Clostridiales bacterium]|nr:hypothetical protein [Clostridiales bacterium]